MISFPAPSMNLSYVSTTTQDCWNLLCNISTGYDKRRDVLARRLLTATWLISHVLQVTNEELKG